MENKSRRKFLRDIACASAAAVSAPYLSFGAEPNQNLTLRTGEDVVWDAKAMRAIGGSARMNSFIDAPMRPGWY